MPDRSPPRDVQTIRRFFLVLMIVAGLFLSSSQVVLAQGSLLTYGSNTLGSLTATAPLAFYTFSGATDDLVTIQVIGISPGMLPGISLNSVTQQQLANSSSDPFGIGDGQEARLSYRLPQDGTYTILISNANGTPGDFLLRLVGVPATAGMDLSPEGAANADIAPNAAQIVNIPANPAAAQTVNISTQTAAFGFRVGVRQPDGQALAVLTGDAQNSATTNLPPGQGNYTLEITALQPGTPGTVSVTVVPATAIPTPPPAEQPPAPPASTEEVAPPAEATLGNRWVDLDELHDQHQRQRQPAQWPRHQLHHHWVTDRRDRACRSWGQTTVGSRSSSMDSWPGHSAAWSI